MLPSEPPPDPRCPGVRKAGVDVHRKPIRLALRDWMRDRNVSVRDLAAIVRSNVSRVESVIGGFAPLPYEWLSLLPTRDRRELQGRIDYAIETQSRLSA